MSMVVLKLFAKITNFIEENTKTKVKKEPITIASHEGKKKKLNEKALIEKKKKREADARLAASCLKRGTL